MFQGKIPKSRELNTDKSIADELKKLIQNTIHQRPIKSIANVVFRHMICAGADIMLKLNHVQRYYFFKVKILTRRCMVSTEYNQNNRQWESANRIRNVKLA